MHRLRGIRRGKDLRRPAIPARLSEIDRARARPEGDPGLELDLKLTPVLLRVSPDRFHHQLPGVRMLVMAFIPARRGRLDRRADRGGEAAERHGRPAHDERIAGAAARHDHLERAPLRGARRCCSRPFAQRDDADAPRNQQDDMCAYTDMTERARGHEAEQSKTGASAGRRRESRESTQKAGFTGPWMTRASVGRRDTGRNDTPRRPTGQLSPFRLALLCKIDRRLGSCGRGVVTLPLANPMTPLRFWRQSRDLLLPTGSSSVQAGDLAVVARNVAMSWISEGESDHVPQPSAPPAVDLAQ
jgi:hypothetical protein